MLLLLIIFFSFLSVYPVKALDEFSVKQNINYSLDIYGNATVNQDIELINNLSEIYPKEYQTSIYGPSIENIKANDSLGNIYQKSEKINEATIIYLKFNQTNLGKGQVTKFHMNYTIPKLAIHKGSVWEVSVPEFKNLKLSESISVNLEIPESFGNISFSSITPEDTYILDRQTHIKFTEKNLKDKKILFIFGNYQLFDFSFKYFLDNNDDDAINTEIALPPETDSQKIFFKEITPKPNNIKIDSDGNWLAQYTVNPKQNIEVNVTGQAKIITSSYGQPDVDIKSLTSSQDYWPVDDPTITAIADTLKTPKDIYNYVVSTLSYNYDNINSARRKGALEAINNPTSSLCTEFTDLFVTLARAKGIPSREIEGFAYTNNPKIKPVNTNADVLHAWPQYYDASTKKWMSIDPTWEKTTNGIDFFNDLDLNHFILAVHGKDSNYPPPPGSYKNNRNVKTVSVEFATEELKSINQAPQITPIKTKFNEPPQAKIYNPNPNSLRNISISMANSKWKYEIAELPPYSSQKLEIPNINFFLSLLPKNKNITLELQTETSQNVSYFSIAYPAHYLNLSIIIALAIFLLSLSGIILAGHNKTRK
jgi:hypothetical protein